MQELHITGEGAILLSLNNVLSVALKKFLLLIVVCWFLPRHCILLFPGDPLHGFWQLNMDLSSDR